jgi:hypothetical protein
VWRWIEVRKNKANPFFSPEPQKAQRRGAE